MLANHQSEQDGLSSPQIAFTPIYICVLN